MEAGRRRAYWACEVPLASSPSHASGLPLVTSVGSGGQVKAAIAMALRAVVFELDGVLVLPSVSCALRRAEAESAEPR